MDEKTLNNAIGIINNMDINKLVKKLESKGKTFKPSFLNEIRYSMVDVLRDELIVEKQKVIIDKKLIDGIINNFVKKDGERLNSKSYDLYLKKAENMKIWTTINELIKNKDNKTKINEIIEKIKKRDYMTARKDANKSSFNADFVFYNQILTKDPLKEQLNDYVLNRFNQVIKESKKVKEELQLNKTLFEELKITYPEFVKLVDDITGLKEVKSVDTETQTIHKPTIDERIILNLYKNIPIRDNFSRVKLVDTNLDDENVNYINITDKTFHLNDYKKSSMDIFGKKIYRIPDYLNELIKSKYNDGWRVLVGKNKTTFYNDNLSKYIRRIFLKYLNKSVSINDIRKAFVSYWAENKSVKQQKLLAERMLHSYETARNIYKREENDE